MNAKALSLDGTGYQKGVLRALEFIVVAAAFFYLAAKDFLLFQTISETFSIMAGFGIFALTWNARRYMNNGFFVILGIAYLFTGFIDIAHTFSFTGMNVISPLSRQDAGNPVVVSTPDPFRQYPSL